MEEIEKILNLVKQKVGYPDVKVLQTATGPIVRVDDKEILMFGSYNYLGIANNVDVKRKSKEILDQFGVGTGGVRLLTGTMCIHEEMERIVSDFTGHDACVTIASGFGTNAGVIPAIINLLGFGKYILARPAIIFSDEYNHASIVDGCRLSNAKVIVYKHNDTNDLKKKISSFWYKRYRKLIVSDGVFSMDGDVAHFDEIIDIAKKNDALTMVDDAHSIGVIGKTGSGTAEYFNRKGEIDINMGTFSKGLGVTGGFVSCSKVMAEYLRIACRTYMFSDSLSPAVVGGIMGSINFVKNHPELRENLFKNHSYFRSHLKEMGFNTLKSITQVVPLLVGEDRKTMDFFEELYKNGLFAPAVRWPAVPKGMGRIRFSIMANHTKEQLNKSLEIIEIVGKKHKII